MANSKIFTLATIMLLAVCNNTTITMGNEDIADMRTFGLEFPHNKQDENGNTFWHQLALISEITSDWPEITQRINEFKQNNKKWLPNPFIQNNNGKTARQVAADVFKQSGNPVSGLLANVYLKQQEDGFLNQMALRASREQTAIAQQFEHPNG